MAAISIFEKFHIKNIKLEVRARNTGAIKFYRALGFSEEKIIENYYEDGEDAVVMRMDLQTDSLHGKEYRPF